MKWHRVTKDGFPPKPEKRGDVDVLLKVENAPMLYVAAEWDGDRFWVLEPMSIEKSPWTVLPMSVGIIEWAYIE